MKKIIKNNYKIIIAFILGLIISGTTVYAVDAYIESNKVAYNNHNKNNVEEAIDELYEKSGVHKNKWVDKTLNGADPILKDPLIPVEIKNNCDVYYANENSEWYNYGEKRWANAVILIDEPSNANYKVGDHIIEDDIESYFVWIPRYQYKVWDLGKYTSAPDGSTLVNNDYTTSTTQAMNKSRIIDIQFGTPNNIPKMTEPSTTGVYYTHPAFTLGNKDLNGIWVGKFETGYKGADSITSAQVDNVEKDSVIIKPSVHSWRNISMKNMFMTSFNYERNLDSHMIKNTEWGAVAYLSHSEYGIGNEVRINNTLDHMTGYVAAPNTNQSTRLGTYAESTDQTITKPWNTSTGYLGSTTGNISGVYDMSGGSWELVAGCMEGLVGNSGFDTSTLATEMANGYIDKYSKNDSRTIYDKRILGDATGEMGPFYQYYGGEGTNDHHNSWYGDYANFIDSTKPWFLRTGGFNDGGGASQFFFASAIGEKDINITFRIVLAPSK